MASHGNENRVALANRNRKIKDFQEFSFGKFAKSNPAKPIMDLSAWERSWMPYSDLQGATNRPPGRNLDDEERRPEETVGGTTEDAGDRRRPDETDRTPTRTHTHIHTITHIHTFYSHTHAHTPTPITHTASHYYQYTRSYH